MAKRIATWLTCFFWVSFLVTAALGVLHGQARTPLATDAEKALSPLLISRDGSTVTFRGTALNTLTIRVEPVAGTFGKTIAFTVGDVRGGRWGQK